MTELDVFKDFAIGYMIGMAMIAVAAVVLTVLYVLAVVAVGLLLEIS